LSECTLDLPGSQ